MPLPLNFATTSGTAIWSDSASNWVTLDEFRDSATGALVSNALVTATVTSLDSPLVVGPITLTPRVAVPGAYDATIASSVFRKDSSVRVDVRAQYGDNKVALFSQVLRVGA